MLPIANPELVTGVRRIGLSILIAIAFGSAAHAAENASDNTERETYTCDEERKHFESWSKIAGTLTESELMQRVPNSRIATVATADGRMLRALHIRSTAGAKDAVLVIQGNAWSTKAFSTIASLFPTDRLEVFVFDFRGYGLSKPGNPSMLAILNDYQEIGAWLQTQGYRDLYLYAYSFGGVVALNSYPDGKPFRRVVVDSVPARPGQMGFNCRPSYDPVDKVSRSCPNLTLMHGTSDWVVPRKYTQPLIDAVRACGGVLDIEESRGHPFQIEWQSSRARRVKAMMDHLKLQDGQ